MRLLGEALEERLEPLHPLLEFAGPSGTLPIDADGFERIMHRRDAEACVIKTLVFLRQTLELQLGTLLRQGLEPLRALGELLGISEALAIDVIAPQRLPDQARREADSIFL